MNILVVGCSEIGIFLARNLEQLGQDVSVLDENDKKIERLNDFGHMPFQGLYHTGVPIDVDALKNAGIELCDVVLAVTEDDSVNLMVAQVAQEIFKINKVFACVVDPTRHNIYKDQFNLNSISPTELAIKSLINLIFQEDEPSQVPVGDEMLSFKTINLSEKYINVPIKKLPISEKEMLVGILHKSGRFTFANEVNLKIQAGDKAVISYIENLID